MSANNQSEFDRVLSNILSEAEAPSPFSGSTPKIYRRGSREKAIPPVFWNFSPEHTYHGYSERHSSVYSHGAENNFFFR